MLLEQLHILKLWLSHLRVSRIAGNRGGHLFTLKETYIHASNTDPHSHLFFKGQQAIISCIGNENSFIPNTAVICKSCQKCSGYHDNIKVCNYGKRPIADSKFSWQLCFSYAAYHNFQTNAASISSS